MRATKRLESVCEFQFKEALPFEGHVRGIELLPKAAIRLGLLGHWRLYTWGLRYSL